MTPGMRALSEGRLAEGAGLFWTEASTAETEGDSSGLAEAALGLGGLWVNEHRSTLEGARVLAVQRRALAGVDAGSSLGERLRVRLAAEQAYRSGNVSAMFSVLDRAAGRARPPGSGRSAVLGPSLPATAAPGREPSGVGRRVG